MPGEVPSPGVFCLLDLCAAPFDGGEAGALRRGERLRADLDGARQLGNQNVPDKGRVCFCSCKFANLLKQDSAFMRYGDAAQQMLIRGVIGEVDGCKIVKVQ